MSVHNLVRNAEVKVTRILDEKKRPLAHIDVEGQWTHTFPHTSRVSRHLDMMETADLTERLTGGSFFFIENELIDFRDGSYNGFVHTEDSINVFMDVLGYQHKEDLKLAHLSKQKDEVNSPIILRKVWGKQEITVPGYKQGGDFNSILSFKWNPFVKSVDSAFDLVRLICTNGMVGVTSFLNTKVPLMNRWEEHLDIASRQIQNKVSNVVVDRVQQMSKERSSVGDCLLIEEHVMNRLQTSIDTLEHNRLLNLMNAVSPRAQLAKVYKESVFNDKNLAAQLPCHLSQFDLFNIATELRTHTESTAKSSDNALDKFANSLLFDREDNFSASAGRLTAGNTNAFSNSEKAFWGLVA
jgi:hypothetical protein